MDTESIKQLATDVNDVVAASMEPFQVRIAKLENAMKSVAKKLRTQRIHPLDIIPIENPARLAKELEQALKQE